MAKVKNILLIQEDEDDVTLLTNIMKGINNSVNIYNAKNEMEAFNRLNGIDTLPDLIFVDIDMPVMDGFEFLKRLKEHTDFKNISVVILTTLKNPDEQELAYKLGASFFLCKLSDFFYSKRTFQICLIATFCE